LGIDIETILLRNDAGEYGGAIYLNDSNDFSVVDCNIAYNSALHGGGVYCIDSTATAIIGSTIQYNVAAADADDPATTGQGGGIYGFSAPLLIRDCVLAYNVANTSGGGVYLSGVSAYDQNPALLGPQIINCLITNNLAGRDGGGVSANWYVDLIVGNCTFVGNAAAGSFGEIDRTGFGGGFHCSYESDCLVADSIFWNNYAVKGDAIAVATGFEFDPRPSSLTVSYSDIKTGSPAVWIDDGCVLNWGAGNIDDDPLFATGPLEGR
ncbi:unnamed protein product, partial [marine sediment metagenome]